MHWICCCCCCKLWHPFRCRSWFAEKHCRTANSAEASLLQGLLLASLLLQMLMLLLLLEVPLMSN